MMKTIKQNFVSSTPCNHFRPSTAMPMTEAEDADDDDKNGNDGEGKTSPAYRESLYPSQPGDTCGRSRAPHQTKADRLASRTPTRSSLGSEPQSPRHSLQPQTQSLYTVVKLHKIQAFYNGLTKVNVLLKHVFLICQGEKKRFVRRRFVKH